MAIEAVGQVALRCHDLATSIAFYRDVLGLRYVTQFDPPGLAFFDVGGVRLLLERSAAPATLYYRVPDLFAFTDRLRGAGVVFDALPHLIHRDTDGVFGAAGTEDWIAFCKDPAGNVVALMERRAPAA